MNYQTIMQAVRIISEARLKVSADDGPFITSPVWKLLTHAETYLISQADHELREVGLANWSQ